MRYFKPTVLALSFFLLLSVNKTFSQPEEKPERKMEKLELYVDTATNFLTPETFPSQEAPSLHDRESRGLFIPLIAGYLINKGVQGIQKMISDRASRYIAQYNFAKLDHYFYDQISTSGAFDPAGIKFSGFKILRLYHGEKNDDDTVFYAKFILDTTEGKCMEIMNNGIFRLKLDSIMISKSRVRAPKKIKNINVDFEIDFSSTYRGDNGQLFADAPLGKFIFALRNAPLYGDDEESRRYYDDINKKKPALTGECFMVPRSAGYYKNKNGVVQSCWGMGLYSIKVSVKETSKPKFVDKLIIYSADPTISVGSSMLQKKYATPTTSAPAAKPAAKTVSK